MVLQKTLRILVVDDEAFICESVKRLLISDGHEVWTSTSAKEALNLFEQNRFDLVVVDYQMPVMNGADLAVAIKALAAEQPIILMTSYAEALERSDLARRGVNLMLSKPFSLEELRRAIADLSS